MEEAMTYLVIEEAAVSYPGEIARCDYRHDAERLSDAMSAAYPYMAYMVMTESEYDEYYELNFA
ncbi:MAG: hypothetical protein LC650_03810 [Actinobacteria bacterium]|nr:hypothetical protein [Actinomycetota bacterium]